MKDYHTILIAEDEHDLRTVIHDLLSMEGWNVITVGDGLAALQLLERMKPDLLITDMMMPHIQGLDLIKKAKEIYNDLAVIGYTASAHFKREIEGLGAVYMAKPFDLDKMVSAVETALRLHKEDYDEAKSKTGA